MAGRPAKIDQALKPTQIESRHDLRRAEQPLSVHAHQELALGVLGPEEMGKKRAIPAEGLLPTVGPLANRIFQIGPQFPEILI